MPALSSDALLLDIYKLARRTGRSGGIDAVCQYVVDQAAKTIAAERVSLALYRSDERRLAIVAARGYQLAAVQDVRIQPGEWAIGHVYSCRRALVVRDVRRLRGFSTVTRHYRSVSFAAVPIVAEGHVVGVLSATDKADDSVFTRQDITALRAISGVAALGVMASRGQADVRRLTHAATIDSLTSLFNRQSFDADLRQEIERAKRSSGTLAVLMIDIDVFKSINDMNGHPAGDAVLQSVSDVLRSVVRVFDSEQRPRGCIRGGGADSRTYFDKPPARCAPRRPCAGDGEHRRRDVVRGRDAGRRDPARRRQPLSGESGRQELRARRAIASCAVAAGVGDAYRLAPDDPMTLERASYILILDTDQDRIAAAVRGSGDALPLPTLVVREADDAVRVIRQFGAPAVLMTTLAMSGGGSFSVIESLRCADSDAAVIAWAEDRDLREYAASQLAHTRAKVLGHAVSAALCQRCVEALMPRGQAAKTSSASHHEGFEEHWVELAERARERFGVAGAAAYTKQPDTTEYRLSASWASDAPMSNFPGFLTSGLQEVIATGVGRMWTELVDAALRSLAIVPILRDNETAGALCVFDSEPHAFSADDLETLRAMAGGSTPRRGVPPVPMPRGDADAIIKRELARVLPGEQPLSLILFAATARTTADLPAIDDILAGLVRGDDVVIRWTSSEVLVVLTGVDRGIARRVAKRIGGAAETKVADGIAITGAVTELRAADSFADTVAKAAERLQNTQLSPGRRRRAQ